MQRTIWQNVLSDIKNTIDDHRFETWFRPLKLIDSSDPEIIRIATPNKFICDFLQQQYKSTILSMAQSYSDTINDIVISVDDIREQQESISTPVEPPPPSSTHIHPVLNKRFAFDSFVVGSGNEFAKSAALAVAEAPGKTKFNPLLIYGGVGLGKTHLLQAIGNFLLSIDSNYNVTYVTSEEFYLNFIDAIKNNITKTFTKRFRSSDVLLMDDVQFLSGKESTQEEFFYIFNTLYQNGKQIVLTSDLPPNSLQGLQDRLISRFQWGLCVDIQPPDLETRVAILKRKAEEDNLNIPENVLYFIAENVSSNIRELEGVVIRLLAFASITKKDITIELVKDIFKGTLTKGNSKITIDEIIEKVSEYYKVPVNNLRDKNRRKEVAHCRQIAMYIAKSITNYSLKTIGLNFGGRDHSTVIHAVQQIEKLKGSDQTVSNDINYIISILQK
jgi:chromosomal replication initiator protein